MITSLQTLQDVQEFEKSLDSGEWYTVSDDELFLYSQCGKLRCTLPIDLSDQVWLYYFAKNMVV